MIQHQLKTVPVQVWGDVNEGIAETVKYLNTIPGVRTYPRVRGLLVRGARSLTGHR